MWLDESWENREEAIKILAKDNYVKAPVDVLRKSCLEHSFIIQV